MAPHFIVLYTSYGFLFEIELNKWKFYIVHDVPDIGIIE